MTAEPGITPAEPSQVVQAGSVIGKPRPELHNRARIRHTNVVRKPEETTDHCHYVERSFTYNAQGELFRVWRNHAMRSSLIRSCRRSPLRPTTSATPLSDGSSPV
jgi:hypothetical protein